MHSESSALRRGGDGDPAVPPEFARALAAFARHEAAVHRHLELLRRLQAMQRENSELRLTTDGLRENNVRALSEMRALRETVEGYTRALKERGLPPERTLVLIRGAVDAVVAELPAMERPRDISGLAAELVQTAIKAYYAA